MSFNHRFEPLNNFDFEEEERSGCTHCNQCDELDYCPDMVKPMSAYQLVFNEIDGEYKVLNHQGNVVWNADTKETCLKEAADFLGVKPSDIEVKL